MESKYHYATVSEAIDNLRSQGYTTDFNLVENALVCNSDKSVYSEDHLVINDIYRYEGDSDPGDEATVYAIQSTSGIKGILVTGYGMSGNEDTNHILMKLEQKKNNTLNVHPTIVIQAEVNAPIDIVWDSYINPIHIMKWNHASEDWHTTKSVNDLRVGGKFESRMEAKDGSFGFDFWGIYSLVEPNKHIKYTLGDDRKANIQFESKANSVLVTVIFESESTNPIEMKEMGLQAILDNFKKYTEGQK